LLLLVAAVLGAGVYVIWRNLSVRSQMRDAKVRFYQDSMHPWVKSKQPGKCTICGMDLTPICEGEKEFRDSGNLVVLSSNSITVLNVQTEEVKRWPLNRTLRVAGTLEANENHKIIIAAPAPARIETMNVAHVGVEVTEGQTLITLFSPELIQKRGYFRAGTANSQSPSPVDLYSGSLVAPWSGTVVERPVSVGQYVAEGEKLITIADPSILSFRFDVYERQLSWITPGQSIDVTTTAVPGKKFQAVISFVEPSLDDATRAVKARADINNPVVSANGNPQRLLKFGMYAEGYVRAEIPDVLAVSRTAVLFPGAAYAYVDKGNGAYERRRITLGRQGDELWEVLRGLEEGERVVIAGNVLIDAQAQFNLGGKSDATGAEETINEIPAPGDLSPAVDSAKNIPGPTGAQPSQNKMLSHVEMDKARMALRDKMWTRRNDMINGVGGEKSAGTLPTAATPAQGTNVTFSDPPKQVPAPVVAQTSGNAVQSYRNADKARMAISSEMRTIRNAAVAGTHGKQTTNLSPLTTSQRQALQAMLTEADGIGRALAADDIGQFNEHFARLSTVLPPLQKELAAPHRWEGLIQRLTAASQRQPAKDLTEARKQFLPFSATVVELVGQLRKEDPSFAELKIYHCPMAPKPGLWFQEKGELRNPFYGKEMLTCGEEVKP